MLHIFIVVTMGQQIWQFTWPGNYLTMKDCEHAFIEEVWPMLKVNNPGAEVHLICSQDYPQLAKGD